MALESREIARYVALGREGKRSAGVDPALRPAAHRMKQKLATEAGRTRYARRKWLSEAPHGWSLGVVTLATRATRIPEQPAPPSWRSHAQRHQPRPVTPQVPAGELEGLEVSTIR